MDELVEPGPEPETDEDAPPWERLVDEPPKAHAAFRMYRNLSPAKRDIAEVAKNVDISDRRAREWAVSWDWRERAAAWDDHCHHLEDQERLEAIRAMHGLHRKAGRAAITKAIQALQILDPGDMPAGAVARMLELGARLERSTLIVSVEELQGIYVEEEEGDDPWERIAAELDPQRAP